MLCAYSDGLGEFIAYIKHFNKVKGENMSLDDMIFDVYCYVDHIEFMTVEEQQVSSIFNEELDLY